jgi:nucleoside-triphosphatase THEP1
MKMIVLTGDRGIGKSTCCLRIKELALQRSFRLGGIITCKSPDRDIIVEDLQTGRTDILASTENRFDGPHYGKYHFNPCGIEFGTKSIKRGASADILFVDELGYLELRKEGFYAVLELLSSACARAVVIVVRKELLSEILPLLKAEPVIFEATIKNRSELPGWILSCIESDSVPTNLP